MILAGIALLALSGAIGIYLALNQATLMDEAQLNTLLLQQAQTYQQIILSEAALVKSSDSINQATFGTGSYQWPTWAVPRARYAPAVGYKNECQGELFDDPLLPCSMSAHLYAHIAIVPRLYSGEVSTSSKYADQSSIPLELNAQTTGLYGWLYFYNDVGVGIIVDAPYLIRTNSDQSQSAYQANIRYASRFLERLSRNTQLDTTFCEKTDFHRLIVWIERAPTQAGDLCNVDYSSHAQN